METAVRTPITIALVNDYDIVVMGIAHILDQYRDRVVIAELDTNVAVSDMVDIVLYDCFAQPESDHDEISLLVRNPRAGRVAVYAWNFHPDLIDSARKVSTAICQKALPACDLVAALEAIHAGDIVISDPPIRARSIGGPNWPGRSEGLTDRESEGYIACPSLTGLVENGLGGCQTLGVELVHPGPFDVPGPAKLLEDP
ncbi:MAG TPA: hypothetical protein VI074_14180, partial [Propionibacteriaceae bacterium]